MKTSPSLLTSSSQAHRVAREYAQLLGESINASVSHAPIAFREWEGPGDFVGNIGHRKQGALVAIPLNDGDYMYLYQLLGVRGEEARLVVLKYVYRYQAAQTRDSWILRYEYLREPSLPYPYANHHLHINCAPKGYSGGKDFGSLHLPTGPVTLEQVIRHLITEHRLAPTSPRWEQALEASEDYSKQLVAEL